MKRLKRWRFAALTSVIGCVLVAGSTSLSYAWARYSGIFLPAAAWGFREHSYSLTIHYTNGRTKQVRLGVADDIGCIRIFRLDPRRPQTPQ